MTDWCILRTAPSKTLKLAETLVKDGYDVWTPVETRSVTVPRMNARRKVMLPIMPGYVFARRIHLVELLLLAKEPIKPRKVPTRVDPSHADFRVLKCSGRLALVHDRHLEPLRDLQWQRTPRAKRPTMEVGASIRMEEGSFAGLDGTVQTSNGKYTEVCFGLFGDRFTVKIPTCLLLQDDLCAEQSHAA